MKNDRAWVGGFFSDSVESLSLTSDSAAGSRSQLSPNEAVGTADHADHAEADPDRAAPGPVMPGSGATSLDRDPSRAGTRGPIPPPSAYSAYSAVSAGDLVSLSALAVPDSRRLGERWFHDATISHQSWQSCASCHPDGRADGLNWDLLNDGTGNPKNTKSLVWSHRTPPAMSHGVRGTAEKAVRSGLRNILFALRPETEAVAIDEYLKALRPVPSPYRVGGEFSEAARRGQRIFEDAKVGCTQCHPAPLFTDQKSYAVGTANGQDRPR